MVYWFPLMGIFVYYLASTLVWLFVWGNKFPLDIYMGPVLIFRGLAPMINIIGLDILALFATFLFGIVAVTFCAFLNRRPKSDLP